MAGTIQPGAGLRPGPLQELRARADQDETVQHARERVDLAQRKVEANQVRRGQLQAHLGRARRVQQIAGRIARVGLTVGLLGAGLALAGPGPGLALAVVGGAGAAGGGLASWLEGEFLRDLQDRQAGQEMRRGRLEDRLRDAREYLEARRRTVMLRELPQDRLPRV